MDENVYSSAEKIWVGYAHEGLKITETDVVFYNVKNSPISVHGLCDITKNFRRLPDELGAKVGAGHHTSPAGGRIRFATDSPYVAIRVKHQFYGAGTPHMSRLAVTGFDIYAEDEHGVDRYVSSYYPSLDLSQGYEGIKKFASSEMRQITINMPLFNEIYDVEIGIKEGSRLEAHRPYKTEKPVVFYGSSITHGCAASRPGNTYEGFISRKLDCDYINLGFSGNAKGEPEIGEYIAGLDMSAFVYDYDHNAPTPEHLEKTHYPLYRQVRDANPELPIILVTRPGGCFNEDTVARKIVVMKTFIKAREEGDKNIYFVDGFSFFNINNRFDCTVDGCHPNDTGFSLMADRIGEVLKMVL